MGYNVTITITNIYIPAENITRCLAAINGMFDPEILKANARCTTLKDGVWINPAYMWVRKPADGAFCTLTDSLEAWGYEVTKQHDGRIILEYTEGEKWGDDEQLFKTIAPFLHDNGIIEVLGEDGAHWRYLFQDGAIEMQIGRLTWESPDPDENVCAQYRGRF